MNFPLRGISRPWRIEPKEKVMSWKKRKKTYLFLKIAKNAWIFQISMISNTLKCHFDDVVLKKVFAQMHFFLASVIKWRYILFYSILLIGEVTFEDSIWKPITHWNVTWAWYAVRFSKGWLIFEIYMQRYLIFPCNVAMIMVRDEGGKRVHFQHKSFQKWFQMTWLFSSEPWTHDYEQSSRFRVPILPPLTFGLNSNAYG